MTGPQDSEDLPDLDDLLQRGTRAIATVRAAAGEAAKDSTAGLWGTLGFFLGLLIGLITVLNVSVPIYAASVLMVLLAGIGLAGGVLIGRDGSFRDLERKRHVIDTILQLRDAEVEKLTNRIELAKSQGSASLAALEARLGQLQTATVAELAREFGFASPPRVDASRDLHQLDQPHDTVDRIRDLTP